MRRMCRSTMAVETQSMLSGLEEGILLRSAIADMHGVRTKQWESISRRCRKHLWITDCDSLHTYLTNPVCNGTEDKRLEIDLEDLRQIRWEDDEGNPKDDIADGQTDKVVWIDTSAMIADPLTKAIRTARVSNTLRGGTFDQAATPESVIAKMAKQKARSRGADEGTSFPV